MAYLSQVTDAKVMHDAWVEGPPHQLVEPAEIGIINQGEFNGKIRCLQMFDGRQPLDKLRVWTAEQDGTLTIREATTGEATCTIERKKGVFVTALLYHDNQMYAGLSDGNIRVYREVADQVLVVPAKMPIALEAGHNVVARLKIGSPADESGLTEGMIISHVDGEPTNDAGAVKAAMSGDSPHRLTVKTVNRCGEPEFEMYCEVRKHTGAVTCMEVVPGMGVDGRDQIYSGGRDWQIHIWEWNADRTKFHYTEMFPVHQNAVRCMTYLQRDEVTGFGGCLYSGGDDCTIRCRDIYKTKREKSCKNGFPILTSNSSRGSVRALAAYQKHLFSATADGLLQVWCSATGTPISTLFPTQKCRPVRQAESAQLSLIVANNMVWSGGVDGVIRVWRAAPRQDWDNEWLACELPEHRGAFVNNMSAVQGAADGSVAWHLSDGVVKLLYTESDSASDEKDWDHSQAFTGKEQDLIETIQAKRREMIDNADLINQKKALHKKLENLDRERRACIVEKLGSALGIELKKRYFAKMFVWLEVENARKRRIRLAETMMMSSQNGFMRIYLWRLRRYTDISKENKRKLKFAETLLCSSKKGMQIVYYRKLVAYANKVEREQKRAQIADAMNANRKNGLVAIYHSKCVRWAFRMHQLKKTQQIAEGMLKKSRKTMLTHYYIKLVDYHRREEEHKKKKLLVKHMQETKENGIRQVYMAKCVGWLVQQKAAGKKKLLANTLCAHHQENLRRVYQKKCLDWLVAKKTAVLDTKIEELDEHIAASEKILADSRSYTDEMMADEEKSLGDEIAKLEKEVADLEKEIAAIQSSSNKLRKDLLSKFTVDPNKSEDEHLQELILYLKAHGVNCKQDYDTVNKLKEGSTKFQTWKKEVNKTKKVCASEPSKVLTHGLKLVREALVEQHKRMGGSEATIPKEGQEWVLDSDIIDEMSDKMFNKQAHTGVKEVIIAYDQHQALTEDERKKYPLKSKSEAVRMQNYLVDVVARVYNERRSLQLGEATNVAAEHERQEEEQERDAIERGETPRSPRKSTTKRSGSRKSLKKRASSAGPASGTQPAPVSPKATKTTTKKTVKRTAASPGKVGKTTPRK